MLTLLTPPSVDSLYNMKYIMILLVEKVYLLYGRSVEFESVGCLYRVEFDGVDGHE